MCLTTMPDWLIHFILYYQTETICLWLFGNSLSVIDYLAVILSNGRRCRLIRGAWCAISADNKSLIGFNARLPTHHLITSFNLCGVIVTLCYFFDIKQKLIWSANIFTELCDLSHMKIEQVQKRFKIVYCSYLDLY